MITTSMESLRVALCRLGVGGKGLGKGVEPRRFAGTWILSEEESESELGERNEARAVAEWLHHLLVALVFGIARAHVAITLCFCVTVCLDLCGVSVSIVLRAG